jgi:histidinol-phosphate aminotransferase
LAVEGFHVQDMADFSQFVPAHIRRLAETSESKPLKQSASGSKPVALNLNENPFHPSPQAVDAIRKSLNEIHRYPEIHGTDLHQRVAQFHNVSPAQVLVTAGATELLSIIARALLAPGLNAVTSAKSFIVYKFATQVTEGKLIEVPTRNSGYDLEAINKAIDSHTRIVFLANPNNPTATLVTADEVDHFVNQLPAHVLLVLDEAYGDFATHFAKQRNVVYSRSFDYVAQNRNLIVLKTFSKAHGLAGLRVGYGIGPRKLISLFAPLRSIFSVSSVAQAAACAALHDSEHIRRVVENNAEQANVLSSALQKLGFHIPLTWANFLYVDVGGDASKFAERLRDQGIIVQPLGLWGAPTAIRVSIGTPEQNQQFLAAMKVVGQT